MINNNFTIEEIKEMALMATAYEKYGAVCTDEIINMFIDEYIYNYFSDSDFIINYITYEMEEEEIYIYNDFSEMMHGVSPEQVANYVYYGDYGPAYDYYFIDNSGYLNGISEKALLSEAKHDKDFLKYLCFNVLASSYKEFIKTFEINRIRDKTNILIKKGY